jgi:hypothetical protein
MSLVRTTEKGVPVRKKLAPEICQPPSAFCSAPFCSF